MTCAGRSLERLDLSGNTMTGEAAPALAQALRGQPSLRALNLNDVGLGDEGVAAIVEVRWPSNQTAGSSRSVCGRICSSA